MHHFDGAAGESWYVYGLPLRQALLLEAQNKNSPSLTQFKVVSVGLGLGYIEILWSLLKAEFTKPLKGHEYLMTLDSFEKIESLQQNFLAWIEDQTQASSEFYDLAFQKLVAGMPALEALSSLKEFKDFFRLEIKTEKINLYQDLLEYSEAKKWNFICFDAFSKNTDQCLWNSDFLDSFFERYSDTDCIFSTYAATTQLKQVLVKHRFTLIKRVGYSGKRECTLAVRGKFTDDIKIFQTF